MFICFVLFSIDTDTLTMFKCLKNVIVMFIIKIVYQNKYIFWRKQSFKSNLLAIA